MSRLEGKVAIVTGGASGMGAATCRLFAEEGAKVVIADLQEEPGEALSAELPDAMFLRTDVGIEADIAALVNATRERFGRIDCLYNNAGFGGVSGTIDETDMGGPYERTVAGLLTGPILGMKHVAPVMREQEHGSIISTASVAGLRGGFGPHVYSALKAAVIGLTQSVALELSEFRVRVNAICPGGIMTPIFLGGQRLKPGANASLEDALRPRFSQIQPIPRAGEGRDIANAALFLASDDSTFVTGQALVVDGGLTMGRRRTGNDALGTIASAVSELIEPD